MDAATKTLIREIAWDATIGAGNDSERVSYGKLKLRLGRRPTFEECEEFRAAWLACVQQMAQP